MESINHLQSPDRRKTAQWYVDYFHARVLSERNRKFLSIRRSWNLLVITTILVGVPLTEVKAETPLVTVTSINEPDDPKASKSDFLKPSPNYSPRYVVRIQLQALADNDHPYRNAGIEVAFRFASLANKIATGPLERFIQMVQNPVYRPMLNHQAAFYGELQVRGNQAAQVVILTTPNGERVGYFFTLSRQVGGPCHDCWMTDSVLRFEVGEEFRET